MSLVDVIVIAAMEEELVPFLQHATSLSEPLDIGNSVHRTGDINGCTVLFVHGGIGDQGLVHARTAQKARFVIGVVGNDLQHQTGRLPAVAHKTHQQSTGIVQLGAVVHGGRKLFHVHAAEIIALDGGAHFVKFTAQLAKL